MRAMAPKGMAANGLRIAQARLALPGPPSQAEFARTVGIHWVTQSNIENNKAKVSLELLERIAEATGTTREHLLGDDEDEEAALVNAASLASSQEFQEFAEALAHMLERVLRAKAAA